MQYGFSEEMGECNAITNVRVLHRKPLPLHDDKNVYRTGWVLFDKSDPTKVLARAQEPIFEPVHDSEKKGQIPNIVFVEGLVRDGNRWLFYYGGADKYVGVASAGNSLSRSATSHQAFQARTINAVNKRTFLKLLSTLMAMPVVSPALVCALGEKLKTGREISSTARSDSIRQTRCKKSGILLESKQD